MFPLQLLKAVIMARKSKRAALVLMPQQRATLKELAASRSAATREVERANVMLGYADGLSVTELQRQLGFSRPMIYRCVDKALAAGVQMGLKDKYHRPHEPEISDAAMAWVVSIACTKSDGSGAPSVSSRSPRLRVVVSPGWAGTAPNGHGGFRRLAELNRSASTSKASKFSGMCIPSCSHASRNTRNRSASSTCGFDRASDWAHSTIACRRASSKSYMRS
jgi:hypothetical protein